MLIPQKQSKLKTMSDRHTDICELNEWDEFDFFMQFEWPEHIETALRRLAWIALIEEAEGSAEKHTHTGFLRLLIVNHPDSPPEVLSYLAATGNRKLLIRIAEHPHASAEILTELSRHDDGDVRLAVADNGHTPLPVLLEMAVGLDADVRYRLAENPALPATILSQLANDENAYVSTRAQRTLMRRRTASVKPLPLSVSCACQRKAM